MLLKIFLALQGHRARKNATLLALLLSILAVVGSVVALGPVGLLFSLPCVILGAGSLLTALASIRVAVDPTAAPIVGWRSGWFDVESEQLGDGRTRNLFMARSWQDDERIRVESTVDAQVAALVTEVQYLREALQLATGNPIRDVKRDPPPHP
jgi:hypothetical protein